MTTQTLPQLTGSDKQIEWATDIRAQKIEELGEFRAMMDAKRAESNGTPEQVAAMTALVERAIADYQARGDAQFWIDSRDESVEFQIRQIARTLRG